MSTRVKIVNGAEELRQLCNEARKRGESVGFVPTMGALHAGHLALVTEAKKHATFIVASIFINPTQFAPNEDFAAYPRDVENDIAKLASVGVNAVFTPEASTIYPPGEETRVRVGRTAAPLCGISRPHFFEGVATVVTKLFNLVGPCTAVFGKKDYQQLAVIRRMAADLMMPVTVVGHPIVRELDGLAMSSRNRYLSAADRERALSLSRGLAKASRAFKEGERRSEILRSLVDDEVRVASDSVDYVEIADPETLVAIQAGQPVGERALVAIACRIGATRLIDNEVLGENG